MAEIRISKLSRQFNVGLYELVDILRQQGLDVEYNPNAKIPDEYLPFLEQKFMKDAVFAQKVEVTKTKISTLLDNYKKIEKKEKKVELIRLRKEFLENPNEDKVLDPDQGNMLPPKKQPQKRRRIQNSASGLDWGFFGIEEKKDVTETPLEIPSEPVIPEWELKLKQVISEIPGPRSEEDNKVILQKVADFLVMPTAETTSRKEEVSKNDLLGDIISAVTTRNESKLVELFDVVNGRDIASRREITTELIKDGHIVGENFWFFVNFLLTLNATLYKKPIVDGTLHISEFHQYIPDDQNIIIRTSELLFKDKEKIHQAIPFFYFYRKRLPAVVRQDIMDNFHYLTELNDINYVFETLGSNTNEQLYLLSANDSVASMYLGTMLLYNYKNAYGKDAAEGIQSFKLFYSGLNDDIETPSGLARAIISKLVLEDNYQMTIDEAKAYINGGLESFNAPFEQKRKADVKAKLKRDISLLDGTEVSFSLVSRAKNGYLVRVHGNSYAAILPYRFATKDIKAGIVYQARVVKTSKQPMFIILSQKNTQRYEINGFSLVNVGDILDCRFSLYENRIVPDILGAGPIYGTLVSIPRNFNYKIKHKVRVTKVTGMASCEIEVISEA